MPAWRTRGHRVASATIARAVATGEPPQSLLIVGPAGAGKTTLAVDLAAGLLCTTPDRDARPCDACVSCRKVQHGNHPDLHRLAPQGAGREIRIGAASSPEPGTARSLIRELALSPMEGAVRVAIIEDAGRLNEEAQNALLKTLEEPPPGTCLILCTDSEDALVPTVRSRCARLRIGRVPDAAVEAILRERGLADAGGAAAIARIADGRPGRAIALAAAPEAALTRDRITRELLDLADAGHDGRLAAARGLVAAADDLETALDRAIAPAPAAPPTAGSAAAEAAGPDEPGPDAGETRASPAARRRGVLSLGSIWRGLARDVAVAGRGGRAELHDTALLEEVVDLAGRLGEGEIERFLDLLDRSLAQVEKNANPELVLDVLLLSWPRPGRPGRRARPAAESPGWRTAGTAEPIDTRRTPA